MNFPFFTPEPGSLPDRVLRLFQRQPTEEFTDQDLAAKFQVTSTAKIKALLAACISHDLLRYDRDTDPTGPKVWRAGPKLASWQPFDPTPAPSTPPAAATPAPAQRPAAPFPQASPPKRRPRIDFDPAAALVHKGLPLPPRAGGAPGDSKYAAVWARLQVGDCVELPDRPAHSMASWCKKNKRRITVRRLSPTTKGVWRTA